MQWCNYLIIIINFLFRVGYCKIANLKLIKALNPLTLKAEQSGGVGSTPGRAPPLGVMTRARRFD